MRGTWGTIIGLVLALAATPALGVTAAQKCQAGKLKVAGKYDFCRLKAEAKAAKTGDPADYSKCDEKFSEKWGSTELAGAGMCPSNGDQADIGAVITQHTDDLAAALAGGPLLDRGLPETGQTTSYGTGSDGNVQAGKPLSYVDNGDGTVTDTATGLMWEKKSDDGSIHDKDDVYFWCNDTSPADGVCDTVGNPMDGTMVTTFLAGLNGGGGFAGHTDWRIPNIKELQSIMNYEIAVPGPTVGPAFNMGCVASCTVTTCSCTQPVHYGSSTTDASNPNGAWLVRFNDAVISSALKGNFPLRVRAVRGGS